MSLLTVRQARQPLGISVSKLYQLIARKELPHYRVGGKILIDEKDITEFLARCRVERAGEKAPPAPRPKARLRNLSLG